MERWIHSLEVSKNVSAKCAWLLSHAKWPRASQASQAGIFGGWEYPGDMCILVCKYMGLSFGKSGGWKWKSALMLLCHLVCKGGILTEENLKQIFSPDVVSWWLHIAAKAFLLLRECLLCFLSTKVRIVLQTGCRCFVPQANATSRLLNHPAAIESWWWTCSGWGSWINTTLLLTYCIIIIL